MTHTTHSTTRRPGRFRKGLAAVLAALATSATLIPVLATPAAAGTTSMTFRNCATLTAGSTLSCTVRITDSGGSASDPLGTVTFSLSGLAGSEVRTANSRCTLVRQSGGNRSDCSVVLSAWVTGTLTVSASYASSNTGTWTNSSGSNNVTVSAPTSFALATDLKAVRDMVLGATTTASAGSSSSSVSLNVYGYACGAGTSGYALVTGAASGTPADPTTASSPTVLGPYSVSSGSFTHAASIPTDHPTGVFRSSYVCASSTPTNRNSASVSSASPAVQMTVSGTTGGTFSAFSRAADDGRQVVAAGTAAGPDNPTATKKVELSVNQDDLNPVDHVNIEKEGADLLKARVDALVPASSVVSRIGYTLVEDGLDRATLEKWTTEVAGRRADAGAVAAAVAALPAAAPLVTEPTDGFVTAVYLRGLGRAPSADELATAVAALDAGTTTRAGLVALTTSSPESVTRWRYRSYVVAAFQALTARVPSGDELSRYVGELEAGGYKVNTVEAIALLGASAAEWNAAAPAGRTPASATYKAPAAAPAPAPVAVRPPVAAPAPAAVAPAARKATAPRRATVRKSRKAVVRKVAARKVVAKRTATVRKVRR